MRTALRKMGNSTGMIVPKAILTEIGARAGAAFELSVKEGKIIAAPVPGVRAGWSEAAAALAEEPPSDWTGFGNDEDAELAW